MPFNDPELYLSHILDAISAIEEFTAGVDVDRYLSDRLIRSATERQLQIITEAAFRLGDHAMIVCPGIDWRGIRGMGNRLRHGYDHLNDQFIWQTVQLDLPLLRSSVAAAIARMAQERSAGD